MSVRLETQAGNSGAPTVTFTTAAVPGDLIVVVADGRAATNAAFVATSSMGGTWTRETPITSVNASAAVIVGRGASGAGTVTVSGPSGIWDFEAHLLRGVADVITTDFDSRASGAVDDNAVDVGPIPAGLGQFVVAAAGSEGLSTRSYTIDPTPDDWVVNGTLSYGNDGGRLLYREPATAGPHSVLFTVNAASGHLALAMAVIGVPVGGSHYATSVLGDAPLVYYRLGDATGTTMIDSSGNARHGTYVNAPTLAASGLLAKDDDKAVDFDGSLDYADTASGAWLDTPNVAVEAWIRPDTIGALMDIVSRDHGNSTDGRMWSLRVSAAGKVEWVFWTAADQATAHVVTSTTTLAVNATHHVVGTYDGTTARLYLDGYMEASLAVTGALRADTTKVARISREGAGNQRFFNGVIDEVAIYSGALTADRITTHYALGKNRGAGDVTYGSTAYLIENVSTNTSSSSYASMTWDAVCAAYTQIDSVVINLSVSDTYTLFVDGKSVGSVTGNGNQTFTPSSPLRLTPGHHTFRVVATAARVWNYRFGASLPTGSGQHLMTFGAWKEVGNQSVPVRVNFKVDGNATYAQLGSSTSAETGSFSDYTFTVTLAEPVDLTGFMGFSSGVFAHQTFKVGGQVLDAGDGSGWGLTTPLRLAAGTHTVKVTPSGGVNKRYVSPGTADTGPGAALVDWGLWQEPGNQWPAGALVFSEVPDGAVAVTASLTGTGAFTASSRQVVVATPVVAALSDTFTRGDSPTSLGSTTTGSVPWQPLAGTWGIKTNRAYVSAGPSNTIAVAVVETGASDCTVQVTVPVTTTGSSHSGLALRMVSNGNGYLLEDSVGPGSGNMTLYKGVGGSYTALGTAAGVSFVDGDTVTATLSGPSIVIKVNGTTRISVEDSTYLTATKHGLYHVASNGIPGTVEFDNFSVAGVGFAGSGVFTATASKIEVRSASLSGAGAMSAAVSSHSLADLAGTGQMTAVAIPTGPAGLAGSGEFTATVSTSTSAQVAGDIVGTGDLTAEVTVIATTTADLAGAGDFAATSSEVPVVAVAGSFIGAGGYSAVVVAVASVTAQVSGAGAFSAAISQIVWVVAAWGGSGAFSNRPFNGPYLSSGVLRLSASGGASTVEVTVVTGWVVLPDGPQRMERSDVIVVDSAPAPDTLQPWLNGESLVVVSPTVT